MDGIAEKPLKSIDLSTINQVLFIPYFTQCIFQNYWFSDLLQYSMIQNFEGRKFW